MTDRLIERRRRMYSHLLPYVVPSWSLCYFCARTMRRGSFVLTAAILTQPFCETLSYQSVMPIR